MPFAKKARVLMHLFPIRPRLHAEVGPKGRRVGSMASQCLSANPQIVLREEFDDWAILFDPETGNAFGLNPVGVFIWKLLDGKNSQEDIVNRLREEANGVPEEAGEHLNEFFQQLTSKGLAGFDLQNNA